jgi:hypothetical protein
VPFLMKHGVAMPFSWSRINTEYRQYRTEVTDKVRAPFRGEPRAGIPHSIGMVTLAQTRAFHAT